MKVFIYWNLTKNVWSVKSLEGTHKGLVVAHSKAIILSDVTPKVSQKGRERVLREKKKYVHAGLVGTLETLADDAMILKSFHKDYRQVVDDYDVSMSDSRITYNPFKSGNFTSKDIEGLAYLSSDKVTMMADRTIYSWKSKFSKMYKENQLSLEV